MTVCFDSNVLVEAFGDEPALIDVAQPLVMSLAERRAKLPEQVIREFLAVAHRKQFMPPALAREAAITLSERFDVVPGSLDDIFRASELSSRYRLQFYDALLCSTMRRSGCSVLLSRDMQDGFDLGWLRIINPFNAANAGLIADLLD